MKIARINERKVFSHGKKAQIAPFLIAIIVVLIVAIMVTVNLGKVSLNKTHASNAADAGALAGATVYDQTLNNLAYRNAVMISSYLAEQVTFLIPMSICRESVRYAAWIAFCAAQAAEYALAWDTGVEGYEDARDTARQFAFNNAGVDQTKPARTTDQTYEDWLKNNKSGFEQWMEDKNYATGDNGSVVYSWTDNVKYGQSASAGVNSVDVDVDGPDFPGLIPMPGLLTGIYSNGPFPICWPACADCCPACSGALLVYYNCLIATGTTAEPVWEPASFECGIHCCPCIRLASVVNSGGMGHGNPLVWVMPSFASCGTVVYNVILYTVPIAFIADIVEDNPEIDVSTTKREPQINIGLWNMNYDDPSRGSGGGIRSRAQAKAEGGTVGPIPDENYDAHLTEVTE